MKQAFDQLTQEVKEWQEWCQDGGPDSGSEDFPGFQTRPTIPRFQSRFQKYPANLRLRKCPAITRFPGRKLDIPKFQACRNFGPLGATRRYGSALGRFVFARRADTAANWAKFSPVLTMLARTRQNLAMCWPHVPGSGEICGDFDRSLARLGPNLAKIGPNRPQVWPTRRRVHKSSRKFANLEPDLRMTPSQHGQSLPRSWPNPRSFETARFGRSLGQFLLSSGQDKSSPNRSNSPQSRSTPGQLWPADAWTSPN